MNVAVRLAEDQAGLAMFRELLLEYEASLPLELRHSDLERELADMERYYGAPNAAFIATIGDEPCGSIAFSILDPTTAIVRKMYVRLAYRRRGVAKALLAALTAVALDRGHTRLVLDTERDRLRSAYELYLSLGFKVCEPFAEVDYPNPTFMQLRIA
jgi:GNAT superfamily N-acetyltransferase